VAKKDGSLRFCVDYRKLNSVTRRDAYPLSRIDECLDVLSGSRYFSAFYLRSSYHQVPMDMKNADNKFLGHVVSAEGVSTDPSKIEAVKDWPVPEDVHEVRSFLGLTSYYTRFVPTFAEIAAPLHALTMKSKKFEWTTQCDHAFTKLKYALISSPILAMPIDNDPFLLDTDACDVSIGSVLS